MIVEAKAASWEIWSCQRGHQETIENRKVWFLSINKQCVGFNHIDSIDFWTVNVKRCFYNPYLHLIHNQKLVTLYTNAVYNLKICIKEDNPVQIFSGEIIISVERGIFYLNHSSSESFSGSILLIMLL